KQGVEVDLPTAPANPLEVDSPEPIVISVDKAGLLYLNISSAPEASIDDNSLVEQVRKALRIQPKRPVMVRGDASGPYQNVVRTLVLLQRANVESVGLVTDPEEIK
ncbi:MAG: biopolymer transporter ExbD, partial [Gammaproteobacteria bacterium]|nr:biopolymer transporter ExbD [Gammaproteobacteria bacterium]